MENAPFLSWMAWTWPTAAFFLFIALCLTAMTLWELKKPGGGARRGVLGLETTRGDRLFITLLGSAFIVLGWVAIAGPPAWGSLGIMLAYAFAVFRWV